MQSDLFTQQFSSSPASAKAETSIQAAVSIAAVAPRLRLMVTDALSDYGNLTADEAAQLIGVDRLSIRPRFSELKKTEEIFDTGVRRLNSSGKNAIVWSVRENDKW